MNLERAGIVAFEVGRWCRRRFLAATSIDSLCPMLVTILGSGTAVPVPDRFPAGYLVQAGGQQLLVDCGPGILRRLAQAGVGLEAIDAVFLTHYHTDHCADLGPLLFALRSPRYAGRKPLQVFAAPASSASCAR
jgi:ribonuclease BN (tRNA processing enzyme)